MQDMKFNIKVMSLYLKLYCKVEKSQHTKYKSSYVIDVNSADLLVIVDIFARVRPYETLQGFMDQLVLFL